jgi:hypothetical protein
VPPFPVPSPGVLPQPHAKRVPVKTTLTNLVLLT